MQRAFLYGDLLIETIRVQNGIILHPDLHLKRLHHGFKLLNMEGTISLKDFEKKVQKALGKKKNAKVRVVASRKGEGQYLSNSNRILFETEIHPLPPDKKYTTIPGIFNQIKKPCNQLSNLKSGNAIISVLASIHAKKMGWEDAIILNEYGRICEATSSNIFIMRNDELFTPPLQEGCVMGIMRAVILQHKKELKKNGINLIQKKITIQAFNNADEVFFTNAIQGIIQTVIRGKTSIASLLTEKLKKTGNLL